MSESGDAMDTTDMHSPDSLSRASRRFIFPMAVAVVVTNLMGWNRKAQQRAHEPSNVHATGRSGKRF